MAGDRKKVPPKRNTGLEGALYVSQFSAVLAIGARHEAGSTSVENVYDGDGRKSVLLASWEGGRIFPEECGRIRKKNL